MGYANVFMQCLLGSLLAVTRVYRSAFEVFNCEKSAMASPLASPFPVPF